MSNAIVSGVISSGVLSAEQIIVSDISETAIDKIHRKGVTVTMDNIFYVKQLRRTLMRITDLLKSSGLALHASATTKAEVFDLLIDMHDKNGNISSKDGYKAGIMAREEQGPTAIADGICIPHTKCDAVIKPGLVAATIPSGVDCEALDGNPSTLFFIR